MALRATAPTLVTSWSSALAYLPERYQLDHSADQYGVQRNFSPPAYRGGEGATRGLTPPSEHAVYSPIKEPFLVPPKYRNLYNFNAGHGKYLYSKDPLWIEARERLWDDQQTAAQVHRKNYEHIRKTYRKQYQDANRFNLDEYLTTVNRVKRAEEVERAVTEKERQKSWEADLARIDAITLLQEKRRKIMAERYWRMGVWKFERASEDLQYLATQKVNRDYYTPENLESKLEQELGRWSGRNVTGKLNMFGRIPYQEDDDGIPLLEVQYQFQSEDLSENGREAYRRLTAIADIGVTKRTARPDATFAEFSFDEDDDEHLGESQLDDSAGGEEEKSGASNAATLKDMQDE